jgi:hypothetical protein
MLRRLTHQTPQPVERHHDDLSAWHGHLPTEGETAEATCGCTGRVTRSYRRGGGYVGLYVQVPCASGHVAVGVIEHLDPRQIRPAQPALDFSTEERTAA